MKALARAATAVAGRGGGCSMAVVNAPRPKAEVVWLNTRRKRPLFERVMAAAEQDLAILAMWATSWACLFLVVRATY